MQLYMLRQLSVSSLQALDRLGRRRDMRDDSAEIFFLSLLQETLVSSSGMGCPRRQLWLTLNFAAFPVRSGSFSSNPLQR